MTAAPLAPLPRTPSDAPRGTWSLERTLHEIDARGMRLQATSTGLRLRRAHQYPPEARDAVAHYAHELELNLKLADVRVEGAHRWDALPALQARWLAARFVAPREAIQLRPGERITDARAFRRGLLERFALGPDVPGADRVRDDLGRLYARYAGEARSAAQTPAPWKRAA